MIEELNACFGDVGNEVKVNHRKSWFLLGCIKSLFCPWNWHHAAKIAVNIVAISFSISSTCNLLHQSSHEDQNFRQKNVWFSRSLMIRKREKNQSDLDNNLDVSYGMG